MELFEAIAGRRSIRQFKRGRPIEDDALNKILDAAIMAPSAGNEQSWRFVAVRDQDLKSRLAKEAGHQLFIEQASVVIVVLADLTKAEDKYGDRGSHTYALQETAAAVENILLASHAMGLGACWVGSFDETKAAEILGVVKGMRPVAIVPIGVPNEPANRVPPRRKLSEVCDFR